MTGDERKRKRQKLLQNTEKGLIRISDVALIFGVTVPAVRNYKSRGIIQPWIKKKNEDIYDLEETKWSKERLRSLRSTGLSVPQAAKTIENERKDRRQKNPIVFDDPIEDHLIK